MKSVNPSQFLGNVYRDLRDRHLLLPAIALIVGILAAPILLKGHAASKGAAASPEGKANSSVTEATPAVVMQELGVTDYQKRLDRLQSKNPFHQQYTAPPPSAQAQAAPSASAPAGSSSAMPTNDTSTSLSLSTVPSTDVPSGGTPATSLPDESPGSSTPRPKPPKPTLYAFRVSIAIGEPGDLKRRENVEQGVLLPSENKPMIAFIGASEDMKVATFVVADTIDDVQGGRCVPDNGSCSLLQLKPGQEAHLHYAPQNRRYNLKLIGIGLAPVKVAADASSPSQKRAATVPADSGIEGFPSQVAYGSVR